MDRAISSYKPSVSKKTLLLIAGIIWLAGGYILLNKGALFILEYSHHILFHFIIGISSGFIFFLIFFFNISKNYINRIVLLCSDKPNIFSFNNFKIYILLVFIIVSLLFLKRFNYIDHTLISILYISIGCSYLLSSIKFFYSILTFKKISSPKTYSDF